MNLASVLVDAPPGQLALVAAVALLASIIGGVAGVVGALGGSYLDRVRREDPDHYREFTTLLLRLRHELRRPFDRSPSCPVNASWRSSA